MMIHVPFLIFATTTSESSNAVTRLMDNFGVQGDLLVAQVVNFCLVSYVLYRFAIKPVLKTVEERQKKISEGLQYAEEMKVQLAAAEQERLDLLKKAQEDAQSLFAKTKRESETYLQEQKHIAEQKVEQMLTQAQGTIESERRKMLAEAKTEVAGLVVATTERVLKDVLTDEVRTQLNKKASEVLASEGSNS
ncbi:MAG: F0F1 ATP synthase subunit B [Opitutales bacterium]